MVISKNKRLIVTILMAAIVLPVMAGCFFMPTEEEELPPPLVKPATIEYRTVEVGTGSIVKIINGSGSIVAEKQGQAQFTLAPGRLLSINVSSGNTVQEGDIVAELEHGEIEYQRQVQELYHKKTEIDYEQTLNNYDNGYATLYDVSRVQLDLEISRLRLEYLDRVAEQTILRAPLSGQVVYRSDLKTGDWVDTYRTIITIADLSHLQVRFESSEASSIPVGATVSIRLTGYRGDGETEFTGQVIETPQTAPYDAPDYMRRSVLIDVEGKLPDDLRLGSSAQVIYESDRRDDVVVLPRRLVMINSGRHYVNVLTDGVKRERDVEIGLSSPTEVEIVNGLQPGELVIDR